MASSRQFCSFILEQFGGAVTARAMMGEFILYCRGRVIGGIYDDRLLFKPAAAALQMTENPKMEIPYPGAKPMLLVEEVDDPEFLRTLLEKSWDSLPCQNRILHGPCGGGN